MNAPACSWRTGTNSIVEASNASETSSVSSPGIPKDPANPLGLEAPDEQVGRPLGGAAVGRFGVVGLG